MFFKCFFFSFLFWYIYMYAGWRVFAVRWRLQQTPVSILQTLVIGFLQTPEISYYNLRLTNSKHLTAFVKLA